MTYEETRRCLLQAEHTGGIRPGLSRMKRLMELLDDPQQKAGGIIHVAGTNGKGSILAFLDEILRRAGYRVVKYTSPAVFSYLERYVVNGSPVSEDCFARAAERVFAAAKLLAEQDGDGPTAFEMETAIAYLIAAGAHGDFFLLETGMGGRLDATNVEERAALSIIGPVSMDHMAFLGNTVEEIAAEKAGIIKDGCPVVVSAANFRYRTEDARGSVEGKADAPVCPAPQCAAGPITRAAAEHHAPLFRGDESVPCPISLRGAYQQENAGTAAAAIRVLRQAGYDIPEACVREGFANTAWPGRFEIVRHAPLCVLDGAHNANAAERLAEALREPFFAEKRKSVVLGVFKDKEYDKVAGAIVPLAEEVYVFPLASPRGLPADILADCARHYTDRPVHVCGCMEEAVGAAYSAADPDAMVLCCGSLSYLGEAKRFFRALEPEKESCLREDVSI